MTNNDTLQRALIHIDKLQSQIDSIKRSQVLNDVQYRALEQHDIITHVNDYYDKSWNSLLWLLGFLVGLFAIIVPVITQIIALRNQRLTLKDLTNTISTQLTDDFDSKIKLIDEKYKIELSKLSASFDLREAKLLEYQELTKTQMASHSFYTMANIYFTFRADKDALSLSLHAAHNWVGLNDKKNIIAVLKLIMDLCKRMPKDEIDHVESDVRKHKKMNISLTHLISRIRQLQNFIDFQSYIIEIEKITGY